MGVQVKGVQATQRFIRSLPEVLTKVAQGAGRAGAKVVADDAKERCRSSEVREKIVTTSKIEGDQVRARVDIKPGWARSVATWLEYGTAPHFISVDDSVRRGMTAGRINRSASAEMKATLIINGKPVGATVFHEGAQPYPFLRPARDAKEGEAIAAAAAYIASRIRRGGIVPPTDAEDGE